MTSGFVEKSAKSQLSGNVMINTDGMYFSEEFTNFFSDVISLEFPICKQTKIKDMLA